LEKKIVENLPPGIKMIGTYWTLGKFDAVKGTVFLSTISKKRIPREVQNLLQKRIL